PIGYADRIGRSADHAHLPIGRTDETAHDHRNIRILNVFAQPLLDLPPQLGGRLARRYDVLDQRGGDAPIRPNGHASFTEVGVAIDKDAERVTRSDDIV